MDKPRLLDQLRDALQVRHYSMRTEATYIQWIKSALGNSSTHAIYPVRYLAVSCRELQRHGHDLS